MIYLKERPLPAFAETDFSVLFFDIMEGFVTKYHLKGDA
jgi:hypothetical protein